MSVQAILISVPAWAREPNFLPRGLYRDWNDPENLWARFVQTIVSRYRGQIEFWEAWNEPDNTEIFWPGTRADYYQLLKVTYLAVKNTDSRARVLFGGLTYWHDQEFLPAVLNMMVNDPSARGNNYYFDGLVWHIYSRPIDVLERMRWSRERLGSTVGSKEIWINETNVPAWNESTYNNFRPYQWAATTEEQASYIIQSFAHSVVTDASRVLVYRFHDVGEQQAWGVVRANRSLRPAYVAYQVAVTYLSHVNSSSLAGEGDIERVYVNRPADRVTVLWNKGPRPASIRTPAVAGSARLLEQTGAQRVIQPVGGAYELSLEPATANNGNDANDYIIGGKPLILVESLVTPTATPTITPTPGPSPTPTPDPCTSQQRVRVSTETGGGALRVVLRTESAAIQLRRIEFGSATNARIDAGPTTGAAGGFTWTIGSGAREVSFTVRRATSGQAATVPFTVVDQCGSWSTFVGGGPNAF